MRQSTKLTESHPEVAAEWHPAKNGALNRDQMTTFSNKKAWWRCTAGHEWEAGIANRSKGHACPYCSGRKPIPGVSDLATLDPEIAKEWHPDKNGNLSPVDVTRASGQRVWWSCAAAKHPWQATVHNRTTLRRGCPVCTGKRALAGVNDLQTTHPLVAAEWHPTLNGVLSPEQVTKGSARRLWWRCTKHGHSYQATVVTRTGKRRGCPYCSGRRALAGFNDLASLDKSLAAQWHPSRNGDLTPQQVSPYSNKKVWWQCAKGHSWKTSVSARSGGTGCPVCSGHTVLAGFNDLATRNPEVAAEWHPTANGSITPREVTEYSSKRIHWRCAAHGHQWSTSVADRTSRQGTGCPYCTNKKVLVGFNDLATTHPELAREWHPQRNGDVLPTHVTPGSNRKAWWVCSECSHEWRTVIADRSSGYSCVACSEHATSKIEIALRERLTRGEALSEVAQGANARVRVAWRRRRYMDVDILGHATASGTPAVIEYDGAYWHNNADSRERDTAKSLALLQAGYLVVRVREGVLPHLDIEHPRLLQLDYIWSDRLGPAWEDLVAEIELWLRGPSEPRAAA